jgi:hypothetical protein
MWEPRLLATPGASTACNRDSFTFYARVFKRNLTHNPTHGFLACATLYATGFYECCTNIDGVGPSHSFVIKLTHTCQAASPIPFQLCDWLCNIQEFGTHIWRHFYGKYETPKNIIFLNARPCAVVDVYRRLGRIYCLHLQDIKKISQASEKVSRKRSYILCCLLFGFTL